jgi:hypothetical protein|tara:strand:- start:2036 stop:2239 length:204 start_codon:yes stop_codon:yes gene_type:complete
MDTEVIKRSLGESETPPKRRSINLKSLNNPEWITVHSGPNRAERRKNDKQFRKAAKKAKREEKRLGQ